jgi:sodium pump decarboxylase gamma subunit
MILEGLRLMAVGMFTVFAFLTLLVGVMKGSAVFFERFADRFPEAAPQESKATQAGNDAEVALAIVVAEAYRRGQRV